MSPTAQEAQARTALIKFWHLSLRRLQKQSHQRIHLGLRAPPVLRRKSIKSKGLDAGLACGLQKRGEDRAPRTVARSPGEPVRFGPATVAVHDDSDVPRHLLPVYGGEGSTF